MIDWNDVLNKSVSALAITGLTWFVAQFRDQAKQLCQVKRDLNEAWKAIRQLKEEPPRDERNVTCLTPCFRGDFDD